MKKIKNEIQLIESITKKTKGKDVLVGIGDDAAVVRAGKGRLMVVTTDMLVGQDHFSLKWWKAEEIGKKAIEVNVSDIAAMGAKPKYALVSLCVPKKTGFGFMKKLYNGIYSSARRYAVEIVGGDTAHGKNIVINVSMIGFCKKKDLCLRSNAKIGDYILASGDLGGGGAGLELFLRGIKGFKEVKKKHLLPKAQLGKALKIRKFANAMEDVSDGLASEVRNICFASKCGAVIHWDKIPVSRNVRLAAGKLGSEARDFALFGGEDFELVFTCSKRNLKKARGKIVGRIIKGRKIFLEKGGKRKELKKFGYDHFSS